MTNRQSDLLAASQELIEELMGAVVSIDYALTTLMDLPEGALPGEDGGAEAIRDLLTASACREVENLGEGACRAATALIEAVVGRIVEDVHATAELAEAAGQRPC